MVSIMKKIAVLLFCVIGCAGVQPMPVNGGETGHYVNGVEGIRAATLPPPGFYWRLYNVFYQADQLKDKDGGDLDIGFDLNVFAFVSRLVWISEVKILGADYGADLIIPFIYTDVEIDAFGIKEDRFGLGDIALEPFVLAWHGARYDASCAVAAYMPTGDHDEDNPASPGKDFWTVMFTLGGTFYLDAAKTWSASVLARYETHSKKDGSRVTPGDDFHFEWGLGKTLARIWDVGLAGYCQWQVTDDSKPDDVWGKKVRDRVFGIGPEMGVFIPPGKLFVTFRTLWEFDARDRTEGQVMTLTLTKIF